LKLVGRHLVAPYLQAVFGVALVIHVLGWIREDEVDRLTRDQPLDIDANGSVAAEHAMFADDPQIARCTNYRFLKFGNGVFIRMPFCGFLLSQQQSKFVIFETEDVQVVVRVPQGFDLQTEHFVIPAGVQREFVVRDRKSTTLVLVQVVDHDHWYFGQPQFACSQQSRMPRDDDCVTAGQDGI